MGSNRKKIAWISGIAVVCLLAVAVVCYLAPQIASVRFRNRYGSHEQWRERAARTEYVLWSPGKYGGAQETYRPTTDNILFSSNQVVDIGDGYSIVGCYGATDWGMWVGIYGRHSLMTEDDNWPFKLEAVGSQESAYPYKTNSIRFDSDSPFGYAADAILAAPARIENGTVKLTVRFPGDESKTREVSFAVQTSPWADESAFPDHWIG